MNRKMKAAVLGTGAIGSCIGADLSESGADILLIDQWSEHVEVMKKKGLTINVSGEEKAYSVRAAHLYELASLNEKFDIVLLTSKSYDSCWMAEFIKPYLDRSGIVVSVQNSLNNEWLTPVIGSENNIGCVVELSAELYVPGIVKRNTDKNRTWFAVGELDGRMTPRLEKLSELLAFSGKTDISSNIWGAKWSKLTANCMMQGISALLGLPDYEAMSIPSVLNMSLNIGREAAAVGIASGYHAEAIYGLTAEEFGSSTDEMIKNNLNTLTNHIGKKAINSVLQDHIKGRLSEINYLNGLVVEKGEKAGIPASLNREIVMLTEKIRNREIKPAIENIHFIEEIAEKDFEGGNQ